ncbi:hypothetical protein OROGR_031392 [Orobanche gracilis]
MGSTPAGVKKLETASLPLGRGKAAYYPTPSDPANAGYTEYDAKEHLAALVDKLGRSLTDIDVWRP